MVGTSKLQNEVNNLLGDKTPHEFQSPVKPIAPIYSQPQIRSDVKNQQTSSIVPPIQTKLQQNPYSQSQIFEDKKNNHLGVIIITAIVIFIGTATIFTFRTKILGPLTYSDCLKIEGSSRVDLEPKYCVTPDGEMFFENLSILKGNSS